ncbi:MAG: hypothetical protein E7576_08095 [Ruminococcaceae bacterium]|nr:hypothetical protein [Oscillospiraceae bacterium]
MAGEASRKANAFINDHYDRMSLALPKGLKAEMADHVAKYPEKYRSITDLVAQAVRARIAADEYRPDALDSSEL